MIIHLAVTLLSIAIVILLCFDIGVMCFDNLHTLFASCLGPETSSVFKINGLCGVQRAMQAVFLQSIHSLKCPYGKAKQTLRLV